LLPTKAIQPVAAVAAAAAIGIPSSFARVRSVFSFSHSQYYL